MDIIKTNKVLQYIYRPPPKGTFNNKKVNNLIGEPCKKISLKETVKAQLTTIVITKVSAQVKDNIINKEEEELDKQYTAIKINYKVKVISKA